MLLARCDFDREIPSLALIGTLCDRARPSWEMASPAAPSNRSLNAPPFGGGFIGESATNEESPCSAAIRSSSLSPASSIESLVNGSASGRTRWRFSFTGDGETGSPRKRLRALETVLFGTTV